MSYAGVKYDISLGLGFSLFEDLVSKTIHHTKVVDNVNPCDTLGIYCSLRCILSTTTNPPTLEC
jgi:hypothetical protein